MSYGTRPAEPTKTWQFFRHPPPLLRVLLPPRNVVTAFLSVAHLDARAGVPIEQPLAPKLGSRPCSRPHSGFGCGPLSGATGEANSPKSH